MHASRHCSRNYARGIIVIHAGDVLPHGTRKKLDVLGKIAHIVAEIFSAPRKYIRSVEANEPCCGWANPTISRASVDLPAADGPMIARASPGTSESEMPCSTG